MLATTAEVARARRLAAESTLVDLGEHRLRDLAAPERVFQVVHPGCEPTFPPLRSLDAFPGNLPVQLTSFVGSRRGDDRGSRARSTSAGW